MQPPQRLVDPRGDVTLGVFDAPVAEVNAQDFALRTPLGRPAGALARRFGFNQFQFFGVVSDALMLGCAIIDIKLLSGAFIYFFDPRTGELIERSFRLPLSFGLSQVRTPGEGTTTFTVGKNRFEMGNRPEARQRTLKVELASGEGVSLTLDEGDPPIQPMCICTRAGLRGWVYAQKTAGVAASGVARFGGKEVDLAAVGATGHHDWSAGYMRRETWWNWACISGRLPDGRRVGLNVSCGVNESSYTESCFWVEGALVKVDAVAFEYDGQDLRKPWRIRSNDGLVDLTFHPLGSHGERVDAWIVASSFEQLFGRFEGRLGAGGDAVVVDGLLGYAEEHFARW